MTRELSATELNELILRLCEDEALELTPGGNGKIYIPFIMNDAAEAFCTLTDTIVPSALPEDVSMATRAEITSKDGRTGLIIRSDDTVLTMVWYTGCTYEEQLYQYHRIMHCWASGNEHMRMLVYMVGTMRDKYEYLGAQSCNETEKSLLPLMEYRPFRLFSPMQESLDSWYPETKAGYALMETFVKEAGDSSLLRLMRAGRLAGKWLDQRISERIASSRRIFELIYARICAASEVYEIRNYSAILTQRIQRNRAQVHEALTRDGFTGNYPVYQKKGRKIVAFEEHPFSISEMDDMEFSIHLLEYNSGNKSMPYHVIHPEK